MTSTDTTKRKSKVNGTARKKSVLPTTPEPKAPHMPTQQSAEDSTSVDHQAYSCDTPKTLYVPTGEEIQSELWSIGTGEGSDASRVSALRALADIMGLTKPAAPDFPEGMTALLDALAEGLSSS